MNRSLNCKQWKSIHTIFYHKQIYRFYKYLNVLDIELKTWERPKNLLGSTTNLKLGLLSVYIFKMKKMLKL